MCDAVNEQDPYDRSCVRCTVAGIYDLRRLQIKRSGRLDPGAVLALDCCPSITPNAQNGHPQVSTLNSFHKDLCLNTYFCT